MSYTALPLCTSVTLYQVFCMLNLVGTIRVEGISEAEYEVRGKIYQVWLWSEWDVTEVWSDLSERCGGGVSSKWKLLWKLNVIYGIKPHIGKRLREWWCLRLCSEIWVEAPYKPMTEMVVLDLWVKIVAAYTEARIGRGGSTARRELTNWDRLSRWRRKRGFTDGGWSSRCNDENAEWQTHQQEASEVRRGKYAFDEGNEASRAIRTSNTVAKWRLK